MILWYSSQLKRIEFDAKANIRREKLKLVLLPGMDGTGDLFEDFLTHYRSEHLVIRLPQNGPQDHASVSKVIETQLPDETYD